jgi:hypothetical protein
MEGHHPVEKQVVLPLSDYLSLVFFGDENRELLQVNADEVPNAILSSCYQFEAVFQAAVGFVG